MIIEMSKILKEYNVKLAVNSTDSCRYSVLQYNGSGKLKYDRNGIGYCNYEEHYLSVQSFLKLARQENNDLVITPEGSVPNKLIENIIQESDKWPENEKLWCLCAEGSSIDEFKNRISQIEEDNRIVLIFDKKRINYNINVNALWYLFRINEKLGVVIQPKQHQMSDPKLLGEGKDLSIGDVTYCFDLDGENTSRNKLVSYICADIVGLSPTSIISDLSRSYPIVLNLQLNPKPFHEKFIDFRKIFFSDTSIKHQRMIVSNWGVGTTIEGAFNIVESGNAFFSKHDNSCSTLLQDIVQDKGTFKHRMEVQKKGVENYIDSNYSIWKINEKIEAIQYVIRKGESFDRCEEFGPLKEPFITNSYQYDIVKKEWIVDDRKHCNCVLHSELFEILKKNKNYYLPELKACLEGENCIECTRLYGDFFFGICFGGLIKEEILVESEKSNRTLQFLNHDSLYKSQDKLDLFKSLINELENNNFPKSMNYLVDNNVFEINKNAATTGSDEVYNLVPKKEEDKLKKAVVAICSTPRIERARILYHKLLLETNDKYKSQIVIYFQDGNSKYQIYVEPHNGTGIEDPSFTKDITSFKGGLF